MPWRSTIGIAAVSRQTGFSAHTLRMWERRYGFPIPKRATGGARVYTADQVHKLVLLRSLVQRGHRPGLISHMAAEDLEQLLAARAAELVARPDSLDLEPYLACLSVEAVGELRRRLRAALVRQGLSQFVTATLAPLQRQIGKWWETQRIAPEQEHFFSEQVERLLREAMTPLEESRPQKIMLTTLPSERHGLGLLMVEALMRLEGAGCIPIGVETPPTQMARLVAQSDADILALSFSAGYSDPNGRRMLAALREGLPRHVALWVGGEGATAVARALRGVNVFRDLEDMVAYFRRHYPAA